MFHSQITLFKILTGIYGVIQLYIFEINLLKLLYKKRLSASFQLTTNGKLINNKALCSQHYEKWLIGLDGST